MRETLIFLRRFWDDQAGATMVEYSILIGLITVVAIALIAAVGSWVQTAWTNVNSALAANPVAS
jgi:pilus assembly protein Flp/PilA